MAVFERVKGNLLRPVDPAAQCLVESLKAGQGVALDASRAVNVGFHRKLFALFTLAFELWEPQEELSIGGVQTSKNFERFRHDLMILAGFYEAHFAPDGSVRLEAHSVSFADCDASKRLQVYRAVLEVAWSRVLSKANFGSVQEVDRVVNQLIGFE